MLRIIRETHPENRNLESLAFRSGECVRGIRCLGNPADPSALRQGAAHTLAQDFVRLDQEYAVIHGAALLYEYFSVDNFAISIGAISYFSQIIY
jgi:hypothetical protein